MDEKAKLIKELQEHDEKQRLIEELRAHDGGGAKNAIPMAAAQGILQADGSVSANPNVTEELFAQQRENFGQAPQTNYKAPETSVASQLATGVIQAGQTINPFQDEIAGSIRGLGKGLANGDVRGSVNAEIDAQRELQQGLATVNPKSAMAGTVGGIAGAIAVPGGLPVQAAVGAAQMMGAADNGSIQERVGMGAVGAALPYGMSKIGQGLKAGGSKLMQTEAAKKAVAGAKGWGDKAIKGVSEGLKRLGFDADEVMKASNQLKKGKDVPDSNLLVKIRTLYDEGVLAGDETSEAIASRIDDLLPENAAAKGAIIEGPQGDALVNSAKEFGELSINPSILRARGTAKAQEDAVKIIQGAGVNNLLDAKGNLKNLSLREAQAAKEILQDNRNFSADPSLKNFQQEVFKVVEEHLRNVIENAQPELGRLNRVSSAALTVRDKLSRLIIDGDNLKTSRVAQVAKQFLKSPVFTGLGGAGIGGLVAPAVGMDRSTGMTVGMGLGAGGRILTSPKPLSQSLSALGAPSPSTVMPAIGRNLESLGAFLSNPNLQRMVPPAAAALMQQFQFLPPDQQEAAAPAVLKQAEALGLPVEPSKSGFKSEFNGKIHDLSERFLAAKKLDERKGDIGILEWAKQKHALNKDNRVPNSLIMQDVIPAMTPMQDAGMARADGLIDAPMAKPNDPTPRRSLQEMMNMVKGSKL